MPYQVMFGSDQRVELPEHPGIVCPVPPGACGKCVGDIELATRRAIEAPIGLPPLVDCITEDDEIVVAVRTGTPCSAQLVQTIVRAVLERLTGDRSVTILRTEADAQAGFGDPRPLLPDPLARRVVLKTHHAREVRELAYLASFDNGCAVRLNRCLVEADVVIPVGWTQYGGTWNRYSAFGAVFPAFADHAAQQQHWRMVVERQRRPRAKSARGRGQGMQSARAVSRQVDWLLGTQFAFQVVPGPNGQILQVLAGDLQRVFRAAQQEFRRQWGIPRLQRTELVIAGVDHNPAHSLWENLAQAAWAAAHFVQPRGQIILLTDWQTGNGRQEATQPSPVELAQYGSWTDLLQVFGDRLVPFWILSRVRRRAGVCVLSPQPAEVVSWQDWSDWLGIERSSRLQVLEQWVRRASGATLLSHATLVWPSRSVQTPGKSPTT